MKRSLAFALIASLAFTLTSCPGPWADRTGRFLSEPVKLEEINSEFDDYNSDLPYNRHGSDLLIFSSKRERKDVFNLVMKPIELKYDDKKKQLDVGSEVRSYTDFRSEGVYYKFLLEKANQNCNVLGPKLVTLNGIKTERGEWLQDRYLLLYADDSAGNLQIKFVHNLTDKRVAEGPFEVSWLNGPKNDAYPTFDLATSTLYFCSDRDGNFDIFEVEFSSNQEQLLEALLSDTPRKVTKNIRLSTPYDDKCPFLMQDGWSNNLLYFVSDRPGGLGGFDIYYSKKKKNATVWTEPVNMGNRINTKYDEYRPIVPTNFRIHFNYHLAIFSSNRPGGKGGFDLYMAGFLRDDEVKQ